MRLKIVRASFKEASGILKLTGRFPYDFDCLDYYARYFNCQDDSFLVLSDDEAIAWVGLTVIASEVSFYGWPVEVMTSRELLPEERAFVLNHVRSLGIGKTLVCSSQPIFGKWAFVEGASIKYKFKASIDLTASQENILKSVRQSYRPLINKGSRTIETEVYFGKKAPEKVFRESKDFHIRVSGRQTRSDATWDKQYEMIIEEKAFLVEGKISGQLASSTYVMCAGEEAYYGYGVYDRDLMEKGTSLSHWPLMKSIFYAKDLGLKIFILGDVGPEFKDEKEKNIALFKRGFTDQITLEANYKVPLN